MRGAQISGQDCNMNAPNNPRRASVSYSSARPPRVLIDISNAPSLMEQRAASSLRKA